MKHRPFDDLAAKLATAAHDTDAKQAKVRLRDNVKLSPLTVAKAEHHAKEQKAARTKAKRKRPASKPVPKVTESMTIRIPQEVMETALRLADGDMRRVELLPDGSAIVYNHPRATGNPAPPLPRRHAR